MGAFVLTEAGISDGKTATTFHNALNNLERSYHKMHEEICDMLTLGMITTAGVSAGIDDVLYLVAKFRGLNAPRERPTAQSTTIGNSAMN